METNQNLVLLEDDDNGNSVNLTQQNNNQLNFRYLKK